MARCLYPPLRPMKTMTAHRDQPLSARTTRNSVLVPSSRREHSSHMKIRAMEGHNFIARPSSELFVKRMSIHRVTRSTTSRHPRRCGTDERICGSGICTVGAASPDHLRSHLSGGTSAASRLQSGEMGTVYLAFLSVLGKLLHLFLPGRSPAVVAACCPLPYPPFSWRVAGHCPPYGVR